MCREKSRYQLLCPTTVSSYIFPKYSLVCLTLCLIAVTHVYHKHYSTCVVSLFPKSSDALQKLRRSPAFLLLPTPPPACIPSITKHYNPSCIIPAASLYLETPTGSRAVDMLLHNLRPLPTQHYCNAVFFSSAPPM